MNSNDLAALAALGAMGYMYKRHLDGQGAEAGPADAAGRYPPVSDLVNRGALGTADAKRDIRMGGFDNTPAAVGVGTAGVDKRSDMDDFKGANQYRYIDQPRSNRFDNRGGGQGGGTGDAAASGVPVVYGNGYVGQQFPSNLPASTSVAPEESGGIGGAGLAAAGAGAAGAGAAAYYAKVKRQARLADEARAKMKAEAQRGILKDRAQAGVDEDRDARARAQNEADRAAKAQAQADADAKSRAIQAEIDNELKRYKNKTKGADARAGVSKEAFAAGPTVTSETPTKKRAPVKVEAPTDMDDFNRMLRESKVGRATTTTPASTSARTSADTQTREDTKAAKARALLESSGTALPVPTTTAAPTENAARLDAQKKAALKAADAQLAAVLNSKEMADSAWKQTGETDAQAAARKAKAAEVKNAAIEAHKKQVTSIKAGKIGAAVTLGLTGLGLGSAANAATDMTAGQREKLMADVVEGLIMPLGLTSGLVGEGSDLYPVKPLTRAERNKNIEAFLANMSPADKKKYDEAVARQNPKLLDAIKRPSAANKRAAGGQIKTKRMASGGMTSTVSSASKRGDGIASRGKTRCKLY